MAKYLLKKFMEVEDVDTALRREGLTTDYLGIIKQNDEFALIQHVLNIHKGACIGVDCADKDEKPARRIKIYGSDEEIKTTKELCEKLNLI